MTELLTKLQADEGDLTIYSGGANGIDQFWMEVGLGLKLPVVAILPFPSFSKLWPISGQKHLQKMLAKCTETRYTHQDGEITDKASAVRAMFNRDQDLVNACELLVAYWNGTPGGTSHTVGLAVKAKRDILIFNPDIIK